MQQGSDIHHVGVTTAQPDRYASPRETAKLGLHDDVLIFVVEMVGEIAEPDGFSRRV